jgi:DNA-binding winged helix-turn-helix (wHTH) protein
MSQNERVANRVVFAFGPYRLNLLQGVLTRSGTPVRLRSRAREILIALVERAGEVVRKRDLIARVWPDTVVEEGTLRVHIAALRRLLGEGQGSTCYVENVTGRGYRFVAPVSRHEESTLSVDAAPDGAAARLVSSALAGIFSYGISPLAGSSLRIRYSVSQSAG